MKRGGGWGGVDWDLDSEVLVVAMRVRKEGRVDQKARAISVGVIKQSHPPFRQPTELLRLQHLSQNLGERREGVVFRVRWLKMEGAFDLAARTEAFSSREMENNSSTTFFFSSKRPVARSRCTLGREGGEGEGGMDPKNFLEQDTCES